MKKVYVNDIKLGGGNIIFLVLNSKKIKFLNLYVCVNNIKIFIFIFFNIKKIIIKVF